MGCICQRPGRVKHADIVSRCPAPAKQPLRRIHRRQEAMTLRGPTVAADFKNIVIDYIERPLRHGRRRTAAE